MQITGSTMIEFRNISHLLAACENENLSRAAEVLNIAPSTLCASLKSLEAELGLTLFRKSSSGLYPSACARWMFRAGLPLLLLEAHARRRLSGVEAPLQRVRLEIGVRFTVGRLTKFILSTLAGTAADLPGLLVHPIWTREDPTPFDQNWGEEFGLAAGGAVELDMVGRPADPRRGEVELLRDPWVLASRFPAAALDADAALYELSRRRIMTPAFSQGLIDQISAWVAAERLKPVAFLKEHPGLLPRLMGEHPEAAFLLPRSALMERLSLPRVTAVEVDPQFATTVVARVSEPGSAAEDLLERLQHAFTGDGRGTVFATSLTSRRVRYFNMVHNLRSVTGAARVANVAQPALSEQLRKLELTLGARLFERRADGVAPTAASARFAPVSLALEDGLRELKIGGMGAEAAEERHLILGVLPSVNQHSFLINRVVEATLALRSRYERLNVTVREAPNETLQEWVKRGIVGLAIVDTRPAQLPKLPLDAAEALAVIVHPRNDPFAPGPVRLAELVKARLALPSSLFGLRQLLESAARTAHVNLRPSIQIDALSMLIALLRREPICTILPPSAVQGELERGELVAHPIVNPEVMRRLFVVFSGDRSLTEPERELVGMLRSGLKENEFSLAGPLFAAPERVLATAVH